VTKTPRVVEVPICLDPSKEDALTRAKAALEQTAQTLLESFTARVLREQSLHPDLERHEAAQAVTDADEADLAVLKTAVQEANDDLVAACRVYRFGPLGWKAWRALMRAHPSKNKDEAFDVDTLAPTLLRDASLDPKLTAEMVDELLTDPSYSAGEINLLINSAIAAQS